MPTRRKFRRNNRKSRRRGKRGGEVKGILQLRQGRELRRNDIDQFISFPQEEDVVDKVINAVQKYYKSKLQNMSGAVKTIAAYGNTKTEKKVQEEQVRIIYNLAYQKLKIDQDWYSQVKDKDGKSIQFLGLGQQGKFSPIHYNITWPLKTDGVMGKGKKNLGKLTAIMGVWGAPFDGTHGYCEGLRKGDKYKVDIFEEGGEKWFWDTFNAKIAERVKRFKINISAADFVKNSTSARPNDEELINTIVDTTKNVQGGPESGANGGRKRRKQRKSRKTKRGGKRRKSRRRKRRTRRRR